MRFSLITSFVCTLSCLFMSFPAQAFEGKALCDEAKVVVEEAATYLKQHGIKKAHDAFHDKAGPFRRKGLYVYVVGDDGESLVHPIAPRVQGRSILKLKDVMGYPLGPAIMSVKKEKWIHYMYPDPAAEGKPRPKSTYIINVDGYRVACGCYKERE